MYASDVGIVVLAAGASRRLGQAKQLLDMDGQPLIRYILYQMLPLQLPVVVVVGASHTDVSAPIQDLPVHIVHNANWEAGMGASVKQGLQTLLDLQPNIQGILFCVVDQIFLNRSLLERFIEVFREHASPETAILAARYESRALGVPVLFGKTWVDDLLCIQDHTGAGVLLKSHPSFVTAIAFPKGDIDIDHPHEWEKWKNQRF